MLDGWKMEVRMTPSFCFDVLTSTSLHRSSFIVVRIVVKIWVYRRSDGTSTANTNYQICNDYNFKILTTRIILANYGVLISAWCKNGECNKFEQQNGVPHD